VDTSGALLWTRMFNQPVSSPSSISTIERMDIKGDRLCFSSMKSLMTMDTAVKSSECYLRDTVLTVTNMTPTMYAMTPLNVDNSTNLLNYTMGTSLNVNFVKVDDVCGTTGISIENRNDLSVNRYPNPAKEKITFEISENDLNKNLKLLLTNVLGEKVKEVFVNSTSTIIPLDEFNSGIYFYQLKGETKNSKTGKIIVE